MSNSLWMRSSITAFTGSQLTVIQSTFSWLSGAEGGGQCLTHVAMSENHSLLICLVTKLVEFEILGVAGATSGSYPNTVLMSLFVSPGQTLRLLPSGFQGFKVSLPVLHRVQMLVHQLLQIHLPQNHPLLQHTQKHNHICTEQC